VPKARRPPQALQIRLTVGGREIAGRFRECSGLESETEVIEHREGGDRGDTGVRKLPGASKWSNITLKRGIDTSLDLWEWRKTVLDQGADAARADGTIELLDYDGTPVATFRFTQGWPVKYSASSLSAAATDVAIETIELSVERIERV
jgi:phage tail-like protein